MVDFVRHWAERTGLEAARLLGWIGLSPRKYHRWRDRYGKANEHNGLVPRDHWLEPWERRAIMEFARDNPMEGYRRLAFMMIDRDVVAASPSTVYRVLKAAGLIGDVWCKPSRKGTGFVQPLEAHQHWHVDFSYVNIGGTFYYLCSVLDGASRYIVHWEIREAMKEADVQIVLQRAREKYPEARPRVISDNGPQFVAKDFKEFIRIWQASHVRTSPYYPQSNGKLERWHRTLKEQAIRPATPLDLEQARETVAAFVGHYNDTRLHSAIGYVTPKDKLEGRADALWKARDEKLEAAREQRRLKRAGVPNPLASKRENGQNRSVRPEDRALPGGNPSAVADSETAGLGGFGRPALPAGPTTMRKIPGGLGDSVPQGAA
jgi:putative transposase